MTTTVDVDHQGKEALSERIFSDLLGTVSTMSVALGDRLGLYRALQDGASVTPGELAARAGIHERYAREWLEQQAASELLLLDEPSTDSMQRRYRLPPAHAAVLADRDDPYFMAAFTRFVPAVGRQFDALIEAYRSGGGVPWAAFGDDARLAQGDANRPLFLYQLAQEYLPAIPDLHQRLLAEPPARVAEIGSGLGWAAIGIARGYPRVTVDGYDLDEPSVTRAREHAREAGVSDRVRFFAQDGAAASGAYDVVTAFECLHDMPDPVSVLRAMRSMLAPGGICIVMDERTGEEFQAPADEVERLLYGFSILVCLPDGMSHQPSVATGTVLRPATMRQYAQEAGFADIEVLDELEHPFFRFYRLT